MSDLRTEQSERAEHKQNLAVLQQNIETRLHDLEAGVTSLYSVQPQPAGLTGLSMSINHLESNYRAFARARENGHGPHRRAAGARAADLDGAVERAAETGNGESSRLMGSALTLDLASVTLPSLQAMLAEQKRRSRNKIASMFPETGRFRRELYPKHMDVIRATAASNQVAFIAANKIGKSELGCYMISCWLTGRYPQWWDGRRFRGPTTIWACGEKNAVVRDSLQLKLLGPLSDLGTGLIPGDAIRKVTRKSGLADAIDTVSVYNVNGGLSSLRFKSYEEGRKAFQATDIDVALFDEEPPLDVWVEALLRTMVKEGLALLTFTPLSGWSEVVEQFLGSVQ